MLIRRLRTWASFKQTIFEHYVRLGSSARERFWFRGLGDARWSLLTTLDRVEKFESDLERRLYAQFLLLHFRNELIALGGSVQVPQEDALELLGRHHGLPTALMDWTESPYIAAFFAFEDALRQKSKKAAIWVLNRGRMKEEQPEVELIEDLELLRFNVRALEQRGVFMRVKTCEVRLEELLGEALTKYELPTEQSLIALADLESMNLTARNLFRDADAAARTAATAMYI